MPLYRSVIVFGLLLGFFEPISHAAIPLDTVVEQATEQQVVETIEQTIEQEVVQNVENSTSQSIENAVTDSVEHSVNALIENNVTPEAVGKDTIIQSTLETTVKQTTELVQAQVAIASELVASLAAIIPIKSRSGAIIFNDVAVENQWRAVKNEWLLVVEKADIAALKALDITVLEQISLEQLGLELVRFRVDDSLNTYSQLQRMFPKAMSHGGLDRNHIYNYWPQSDAEPAPSSAIPDESSRYRAQPVCKDHLKIGVIDTAIDIEHLGFSRAKIIQHRFLDTRIKAAIDHGTAVVGLLVGNDPEVQGVAPNASLAVASVVYQRNGSGGLTQTGSSQAVSQGATALSLLRALDWLAAKGVGVINMSIAGPPNALLEQAIEALNKQSIVIVAAVGNEGPAAPPVYPAAYPEVIGVTAVDASRHIYRWANRGPQVDFAARGVAVTTLRAGGGLGTDSGTSMAAPLVSALVACLKQGEKQLWTRRNIVEELGKTSLDLGEPGRDNVFGFGLLQ